jgi:cyanophycinase
VKKKISLPAALVVLLFASCSQNPTDEKGKLFIIGGGEKPAEMLRELADLSGIEDNDYLYVLPMASSVPDSSVIWVKEDFKAIGISKVTGHNFLPGEIPAKSDLDSLRNAKLIYLGGGDQSRFMSAVLNTPVMGAITEAYENGSVIAGTSAGAAVMSRKMITGNQTKHPSIETGFVTIEAENVEIAEGLGLLQDVIIDQHFIKRQRLNRLIAAAIENPDQLCVGIDESTAIIVDGDEATVTGNSQVVVIRNTKSKKTVKNDLLGTQDLMLSVFLPGQRFKLR